MVLGVEGYSLVRPICEYQNYDAYLMSIWKFCERSAARLAVGDDPRTGFIAK